MKNCPFCGEEIQDTAKKCKHCKEWLKFKVCPVCGESVPESSEVCPCCDEPFTQGNENNSTDIENIEETNKPEPIKVDKKKNTKGEDNETSTGKKETVDSSTKETKKDKPFFKQVWNDYKGFIIIVLIIVVWSLWPNKSQNNQQSDSNIDSVSLVEDILSTENKEFKIEKDVSTDYVVDKKEGDILKYKLYIEGTTGGYILSNSVFSCFIDSKDIKEFEKVVNSAKKGDSIPNMLCTPIYNNEGKDTKSIFVVIDNTYAYDEYQDLDTQGPTKRINNLQRWLNQYSDDNLDLSLGFIYTTKPEGLAETINEDIITFRIQDTLDNPSIKILKHENSSIQFNNRRLYYKDLSFVLDNDIEDCKDSTSASYKYDCRDINALYNEITKIYNDTYAKGSHSGNALIEYFSSPNIKPLLKENEHVYLFTDGQFELTENQDSLKKEARKKINYNSDYPISNFSISSFSKYQTQFKDFWDNRVIGKSKFGNIDCSDSAITIIGLISKNTEFTEYAQNFYKNKMFTGCEVNFQKLY